MSIYESAKASDTVTVEIGNWIDGLLMYFCMAASVFLGSCFVSEQCSQCCE